MNEELRSLFLSLRPTACGELVSTRWWEIVETMYAERKRRYHTLVHIKELIVFWNEFKEKLRKPNSVALAIFFHDLVYDPTRNDNEEQSAIMYEKYATECDPENKMSREHDTVKRLIHQTKAHSTEVNQNSEAKEYGKEDEHYFLDFDMAVLGRSEEGYFEYADQIRCEYDHVPVERYRVGRARVLETFLTMPHIYNTKDFRDKYEGQARKNMRTEIDRLLSE